MGCWMGGKRGELVVGDGLWKVGDWWWGTGGGGLVVGKGDKTSVQHVGFAVCGYRWTLRNCSAYYCILHIFIISFS